MTKKFHWIHSVTKRNSSRSTRHGKMYKSALYHTEHLNIPVSIAYDVAAKQSEQKQ